LAGCNALDLDAVPTGWLRDESFATGACPLQRLSVYGINNGLPLVTPRIVPALDSRFRPRALANRSFRDQVRLAANPVAIGIGLEQTDGASPIF